MPYTPSSSSSLGTAAPGVNPFDPSGSLATAASSLTDLCNILRSVPAGGDDGQEIVTLAYPDVPCGVPTSTLMREPLVAGSQEDQAIVPIMLPYEIEINAATDVIELTRNLGQPVSGIFYRVINTDAPHSQGGTQTVRCVRNNQEGFHYA
jgi:hypothetical protein